MKTVWHKYVAGTVALVAALLMLPGSTAAAPSNNLVSNPSFEQADTKPNTAYKWQAFGEGYFRHANLRPRTGSYIARLHNTTAGQQRGAWQLIELKQTTQKPVTLSAFVRGNIVGTEPHHGAVLYAEIHLQDGSVVYWNSVPNTGSFGWRFIGFSTGSLPQVNQPIDHIFVIPLLNGATGNASFDDVSVVEHTPGEGAVTIMFDDGHISTSKGKKIMDKLGLKGSAAIYTEVIGQPNHLTSAQLRTLQAHGWDIVSHSLTHQDLTGMTDKGAKKELTDSLTTLIRKGLTVKHFAYPFGAYNDRILQETLRWYQSGRAYEQGANSAGTLPFDIKVRGITDNTTVADVATWVSTAKAKGEWSVIVFHGIDEPNLYGGYNTTTATFEAMMNEVKTSGIKALTYDQGFQQFATPMPVGASNESAVQENPQSEPVSTTSATKQSVPVKGKLPAPKAIHAPVLSTHNNPA